MSVSEFFIKRPVFATVLNLLLVIVGILAYRSLTVREYPSVSIPTIQVNTAYPNASAQVVESDVTFPLEDGLAGIEGMEKIFSSSQLGMSNITLAFKPGTKMESALSRARDRLSRVNYLLPEGSKEPVIETMVQDSREFMHLGLSSDTLSGSELTHLSTLYIKNQLRSIKGVSQVNIFGTPYIMSITLDKLKLYAYGINPDDVIEVLSKSDRLLPAGKYQNRSPITLDVSLSSAEDFDHIIVKRSEQGIVYLKDISQTELKSDTSQMVRIDGKPGVSLGIIKSSDGNPLEISDAVRAMLPKIKPNLPKNVAITIDHDDALFIRQSLTNIKSSIVEATLLVMLIIFLFLRHIRSALVPLITIPVSLVGTLAIMSLFGFSVNTITLLALVLAVGLVVDDAIVVLENIHRHIKSGLTPLEAAKRGSREIGFAIVAMTFTLASVYAPFAFVSGAVGQLFIEFALTLSGAVLVSGVIALTLSPMMCSRLLKSHERDMFPIIERFFVWLNLSYEKLLSKVIRWPKMVVLFAVVLVIATAFLFKQLPSSVAPSEDRGFIGVQVGMLPGHTLETFDSYLMKVEKEVGSGTPEAHQILTFAGAWGGNVIAILKDWSHRKRSSNDIVASLREKLLKMETVESKAWSWDNALPGIESGAEVGLDTVSVKLSTTGTYKELFEEVEKLKKSCEVDGKMTEISHDLHLNYPGYTAKVDQIKLAELGLTPTKVAKALEVMFHEVKPVEFHKDNLRYYVVIKGSESPDNINEIYITNPKGERISMGSLVTLEAAALPNNLQHYNQMRAATFTAKLGEKQDLASGVKYLDSKMASILSENVTAKYVGAVEQQQESSSTMLLLFITALVFIYCILAIQFESFVDPLIIILTVPLACAGALLTLYMFGGGINIFTQLGLVTLIGLVSKHGILLVDFANKARAEGSLAKKAILDAAAIRFRPILMTTAAMVFGAVPLIISSGAGAEARRAIGFVLVGGLSFGTLLTLFVIPTIYSMIKRNA